MCNMRISIGEVRRCVGSQGKTAGWGKGFLVTVESPLTCPNRDTYRPNKISGIWIIRLYDELYHTRMPLCGRWFV